jgi:threonine dehydrogenase-like Zn-dependent dehydrogenase
MKALVWRGTEDIRCESVPDPEIEHDRDAIIKVTSCAICGSDLHLFDHFMPGMESGDIMGHETMGEVLEVGSGAKHSLKVGERVVIPFTIICGECEQCRRGNFSVCERTNRNKQVADKMFGHATAGLFGYTHLTGGYPGGQAEYLRVPYADKTHIKVPEGIPDEKLLFLSDIFPTGWQAAVQWLDKLPFGAVMNKGLTIRTGQTHVNRWSEDLLNRILENRIDPSFVITHTEPLDRGPEMYKTFRDKQDGCIKVVLKPNGAMHA